jgi:hypothetical protein
MENTRSEQLIELGAAIAATREKLRIMEGQWKALLSHDQPAASVKEQPKYLIEEMSPPVPLTERVIELLGKNATHAWSASEVAKELGVPANKMNTMRSTLFRLVEEKRIDKAGPGMFNTKQGQHVAAA